MAKELCNSFVLFKDCRVEYHPYPSAMAFLVYESVDSQDERFKGEASGQFKEIYRVRTRAMHDMLRETGLRAKDKMYDIMDFFPNGFDKPIHIVKGLGDLVLSMMEERARENDAKVIYGLTGKHMMQNLFKRHGYEHILSSEFYKVL